MAGPGWRLARSSPPCPLKRERRKCHSRISVFSSWVPSPLACYLPTPKRTAWQDWKASGLKSRAVLRYICPPEPLSTWWRPELGWTPFTTMASRGRPRTDDFGLDRKDHTGTKSFIHSKPVCLLFLFFLKPRWSDVFSKSRSDKPFCT